MVVVVTQGEPKGVGGDPAYELGLVAEGAEAGSQDSWLLPLLCKAGALRG